MREPKNMGLLERKRYERYMRRRKKRIATGIIGTLIVVVLFFVCLKWQPWKNISFGGGDSVKVTNKVDEKKQKEELRKNTIEEAKRLAASYGYDEAVEKLQTIEKYEEDEISWIKL